MAKYNSKESLRITAAVFLGFVCIFLYAGAFSLAANTLVDTWIPFAVAAFMAMASGLTLWRAWRRLTTSGKFLPNYLCHVVGFTALLAGAFFMCNYCFADDKATHEEDAVVERLYSETHHHTKRISRKHYARGEAYQVYYMEVRLGNGRTKDLKIPFKKYRKLHKGDTISLPVTRGLFQVPVILFDYRN